jgi:hypothetical protein
MQAILDVVQVECCERSFGDWEESVRIRFLLSELDSIERKIRKRLQAIDSDTANAGVGRDRRILEYHALQTRVIRSLMRSTRNEILSVLNSHADGHIRSDQKAPVGDTHRTYCMFVGEEVEVIEELSKRWNLWCSRNDILGSAISP